MNRARMRLVALAATAVIALAPAARVNAATTTSVAGSTTTGATAGLTPLPQTPAPVAWIVVDADSGRVLDGKDIHTPHRPASMAKIMTALAALERMPPDATVPVSLNAVNHGMSNQNPSGMRVGQTWTVKDIVALMMIISANDASYALAEATSGTADKFGAAETATARALGMRDSTFNDPAGLDDQTAVGGGPLMSPYDVAVSVRAALHVPTIAGPASTATYDFIDPTGATHHVTNHNLLLPGLISSYPDANGFKTGSTQLAGSTLAASATRNGRTLITVLMNCADRYNWAKAILDRGFQTAPTSSAGGERLPAVQDLTYAHRAGVKAAAVKFLTGTKGLGTGTTLPSVTATSYKPSSTTVAKQLAAPAKADSSSSDSDSGSALSTMLKVLLVVLLVLLVAVVFLRRRAVRRQRARRAARRNAQAALRRGSLPVVDGRYRAGMRTGTPPQSNVRVHRSGD